MPNPTATERDARLEGARSYLSIAEQSLARASSLLNSGTAHLAQRREARDRVEDALTSIERATGAVSEEEKARRRG